MLSKAKDMTKCHESNNCVISTIRQDFCKFCVRTVKVQDDDNKIYNIPLGHFVLGMSGNPHDIELLQKIKAKEGKLSHLCHNPRCMRREYLVIESNDLNLHRQVCNKKDYKELGLKGCAIAIHLLVF